MQLPSIAGKTPVVQMILPPAGAALIATLICWLAAGSSLGLFFGPILLMPLILPPLVVGASRLNALLQCLAAAAICAICWLIACVPLGIPISHWLGSSAILLAFSLCLGMLARAVGFSSIVSVFALAWLTWPVWLSPMLLTDAGSRYVDWLVAAHPLLAVNGLLQSLGIWSQQPIAYRLTNLGQDVHYSLPGPAAAIVVHALIAVVAGFLRAPRPGGLV